ncbi:PD40 domain-containing protein [Candidatus Woesebacteria bacterium]|nr:PD40 domain-containing protein [Candidatus Woesebacteria bacterium]QQG47882.1 MAG: PD40 domain-containing protein [Candidatus Woesebacteria bacterium]
MNKSKVVFVTQPWVNDEATIPAKIWLMNEDGTDLKTIYSEIFEYNLGTQFWRIGWSNKGDMFFVYIPIAKTYTYLIFSREGNLIKGISESNDPFQNYTQPSWSPDDKLVYGQRYVGVYEYDIVSDKTLKILSSSGNVADMSPIISPDGKKLAILHYEFEHNLFITVFDLTKKGTEPLQGDNRNVGINNSRLLFLTNVSPFTDADWDIVWTPDSKQLLVYISNKDNTKEGIYLFDTDGVIEPKQLTKGVLNIFEQGFRLSPGGVKLVYNPSEDSLSVLDMSDLKVRNYTNNCNLITSISWLPNSQEVAVACLHASGITLIDVLNDDTTTIPIEVDKGDALLTRVSWSPN